MIPPIDLNETPCPWRQEEGIQRRRINMPEPAHCPEQIYHCTIAPPPILSFAFEYPSILDFEPPRKLEMHKQLFKYGARGENQFWAWTTDGRTPIFPIPMEEENYE